MRSRKLILPAALLLSASAALATPHLAELMVMQPQSRLWVDGTSTTRNYNCEATVFTTAVNATTPGAAAAVAAGQKAVTTVSLEVPVEKLDCRNGTMNGHMLKALKANEHATISFQMASYELATADEGTKATLTGSLTLGGVTRPISISAVAADQGNGTMRVTGAHDLRMTEYGIRPPSLMLGTMKVNERVKVGFDLFLRN
jgi:polyisoprenoid-binding protein YceI